MFPFICFPIIDLKNNSDVFKMVPFGWVSEKTAIKKRIANLSIPKNQVVNQNFQNQIQVLSCFLILGYRGILVLTLSLFLK